MGGQIESLVEAIKSKVRSLKKGVSSNNNSKKNSNYNNNDPTTTTKKKKKSEKNKKQMYVKMDKSSSVRVEIRSRKARILIDQTLKAADRPGKSSIPP